MLLNKNKDFTFNEDDCFNLISHVVVIIISCLSTFWQNHISTFQKNQFTVESYSWVNSTAFKGFFHRLMASCCVST